MRRITTSNKVCRAASAASYVLCSLFSGASGPIAEAQPGTEAEPAPDAATAKLETAQAAADAGLDPGSEEDVDEAVDTEADAADVEPDSTPEAAPAVEVERQLVVEQSYAVSRTFRLDPGAKLTDQMILADGRFEFGGEVAIITSDAAPWGDELAFTDLSLLRLRLRRSFGEHLELFGSGQMLIKQPPAIDEPVFQGARLGARLAFAESYAVTVGGSGGPLLAGDGWHGGAGIDLVTKTKIDSEVRFELKLGYAATTLQFDNDPARGFALHELVLGADALFGRYGGGGFIGIDYALPLSSRPDSPVSEAVSPNFLEPGVRLDAHIGGIVSVGDDRSWDLYMVFSFVDRGDSDKPQTMLPIIDGGFDQQQLTMGVQHRFGSALRPPGR